MTLGEAVLLSLTESPERDFLCLKLILLSILLITFLFPLYLSGRKRLSHTGAWEKSGIPCSFIFILDFTPISFQKRI